MSTIALQTSQKGLITSQDGDCTSQTVPEFAKRVPCYQVASLPFQLCKLACRCIVSAATGRGVFDGNVRVGQAAQKTDAQQLSRNLLLVPRATVNVKPNLQIIADDVKCSHGCAVSDLEEDQMFYFRWPALLACLILL